VMCRRPGGRASNAAVGAEAEAGPALRLD
jgi:hypothetical protein